ncbi:hypothetical protein T190115A13A_50097 [Tenacibaculum sp. 190524A02b]|uniref:Uncharacterized protein n=1 Tax=Tenacibaculum vairaonense TaxID=3137860 RepID=A0ABM9PQ02_9FLAO
MQPRTTHLSLKQILILYKRTSLKNNIIQNYILLRNKKSIVLLKRKTKQL